MSKTFIFFCFYRWYIFSTSKVVLSCAATAIRAAHFYSHETFSTWKLETKLWGNLPPPVSSSSLITIRKKKYRISWTVCQKTDMHVFHSSWKMRKIFRDFGNFWKKRWTRIVTRTPDWGSVGFLRLSIAVCEISRVSLNIEIFISKNRNLEYVGQGHDVQHSQWRHSMANTIISDGNINVCSISHLLSNIRKTKNKMPKLWPWKWRTSSMSWRMEFAPFDWKYLSPYSWFFVSEMYLPGNIRLCKK